MNYDKMMYCTNIVLHNHMIFTVYFFLERIKSNKMEHFNVYFLSSDLLIRAFIGLLSNRRGFMAVELKS